MTLVACLVTLVFAYSLCSRRLEQVARTAPMVFTVAGMLLLSAIGLPDWERVLFLRLAEAALVLILFADASRTDLPLLRSIRSLPTRLLSTGMLLTILLGLPLLCMLGAESIGASMFIAAFVAGLAVQVGFREAGSRSVEFTEEWGQVLTFVVFFLFGMIVARARPQFDLVTGLYAVLSLTAVRMLPVAIALIGTRLGARPCCSWDGSVREAWRRSSSGWSIWNRRCGCLASR